ncbi:MAG: DNA topoisomerase, partial [Muribaculaceae bacterium]|nr:DNA topoisomerase [Muribaculaceae bacterium]
FDLTSLQVECNKKFSYSADMTLRNIQSLYEKKVTTYPRVDTTFLSDDIYPKIPGIMQAMTPYAHLTAPVLQGPIKKSKKVFDNSKVTDHHAIIPTNVDPRRVMLTREEKLVYDLIAKRFIAAFYPECEFATTTVMAKINQFEFKATGKQILKDGWRAIYNKEQAQNAEGKESDDNGIMPEFVVGESGPHEPSLLKKATPPPKMYSEGTLVRAMETAGKFVDDEELRDAMKENGIGRPSTRAAIIETLLRRRYITKERKSLVATAAGCQLIDTIKDELLKSAKLTGLWENKLRKIERGEFSAQQFIDELKVMVNEIVLTVLRDNSGTNIIVEQDKPKAPTKGGAAAGEPKKKKERATRVTKFEQVLCPVCGKGHMMKGRAAFGCSEWQNGCHTALPFAEYPADLTPAKLRDAIKKNFKTQNS